MGNLSITEYGRKRVSEPAVIATINRLLAKEGLDCVRVLVGMTLASQDDRIACTDQQLTDFTNDNMVEIDRIITLAGVTEDVPCPTMP